MAEPDAGRISVSRDTLRAELLTMELRLVEKLATKDEVGALGKKVGTLEGRVATLERHDADRQAVRQSADDTFSRREKRIGLTVAFCAFILQILYVTGVFHI